MDTGFAESPRREAEDPSVSASSGNNDGAGNFECNICFELAQDPIVTLCGHLFCWPCLYKWLHIHAHFQQCPICKAIIEEEKLVPLYGHGKTSSDPRSRSVPCVHIPNRPTGQRPGTAPPPDPNHFAHQNPWHMGGVPVGSTRFGNYTFSAAFGGLFPYLNFQVHGLPETPIAGYPYGYANTFHDGHGNGFHQHPSQSDVYLKALLIMVGALVVATLVLF